MLCFFFSSRRRHTRYIGDWTSDVCSSDLAGDLNVGLEACNEAIAVSRRRTDRLAELHATVVRGLILAAADGVRNADEIGRASCRERVWTGGAAGPVKEK